MGTHVAFQSQKPHLYVFWTTREKIIVVLRMWICGLGRIWSTSQVSVFSFSWPFNDQTTTKYKCRNHLKIPKISCPLFLKDYHQGRQEVFHCWLWPLDKNSNIFSLQHREWWSETVREVVELRVKTRWKQVVTEFEQEMTEDLGTLTYARSNLTISHGETHT